MEALSAEQAEQLAKSEYEAKVKRLRSQKNYHIKAGNEGAAAKAQQEHEELKRNRIDFISGRKNELLGQAALATTSRPRPPTIQDALPNRPLTEEEKRIVIEKETELSGTYREAISAINNTVQGQREASAAQKEITKDGIEGQEKISHRLHQAEQDVMDVYDQANKGAHNYVAAMLGTNSATTNTSTKIVRKTNNPRPKKNARQPTAPSIQLLSEEAGSNTEHLKVASNTVAEQLFQLGFAPGSFKSNTDFTKNEEACRIGIHLVDYHLKFAFDNLAEDLQTIAVRYPNHHMFLRKTNSTASLGNFPLDYPVVSVLVALNVPPKILWNNYDEEYLSFDDRALDWVPLSSLIPKKYTGKKQTHPLETLDTYTMKRVRLLGYVGPAGRNRPLEQDAYGDIRLVDCRPGAIFDEAFFIPKNGNTRKLAGPALVDKATAVFKLQTKDGIKQYQERWTRGLGTKDQWAEDFLWDNEDELDESNFDENKVIVRAALSNAILAKLDNIEEKALIPIEQYDVDLLNGIKLVKIQPSNMQEVLLRGAKQEKAKEGYQRFVHDGKEDIVRSLPFEQVLDIYSTGISKEAQACFSQELAFYSAPNILEYLTSKGYTYEPNDGGADEKNDDDEKSDDNVEKNECELTKLVSSTFTFEDVTERSVRPFDANRAEGRAYSRAQKFLWAVHKTYKLTAGQEMAVQRFAEICSQAIDPSEVDEAAYSKELFQARIKSKLEADQLKFVETDGAGEKYGPAICIHDEETAPNASG